MRHYNEKYDGMFMQMGYRNKFPNRNRLGKDSRRRNISLYCCMWMFIIVGNIHLRPHIYRGTHDSNCEKYHDCHPQNISYNLNHEHISMLLCLTHYCLEEWEIFHLIFIVGTKKRNFRHIFFMWNGRKLYKCCHLKIDNLCLFCKTLLSCQMYISFK